jgi:hypothetical protein
MFDYETNNMKDTNTPTNVNIVCYMSCVNVNIVCYMSCVNVNIVKAKARTWISNVICRGIFVSSELTLVVGVSFVDSDVIVDHHCLHRSSHNGVDPLTNPRTTLL